MGNTAPKEAEEDFMTGRRFGTSRYFWRVNTRIILGFMPKNA
jgi:hypothetical protein